MNVRNILIPVGALGLALLLLTSPAAAAKETNVDTGVRTVAYRVEIGGVDAGKFTSVDGLSIEVEVIEYQEANDPLTRKRPGRVKYGDVTLSRTLSADSTFLDWIQRARKPGGLESRDIVIEELSKSGSVLRTWNLHGCFPRAWRPAPPQDSDQSGYPIERILIAVEYVERA